MRVLGIDPGSQVTGYGAVEKTKHSLRELVRGEIKLNNEPFSRKLVIVYEELSQVIKEVCPEAVAIEDIFYGRNIKSLIKQGEVRGVAILAACRLKVPVFEYTPLEIKKSVVGYGRATKVQVQKMVKAILNLTEVPQTDAADALAAAICHINFRKSESL